MRKNNLLASVAVFTELYNNQKNIYDVLSEFIKAAINMDRNWTFSPDEINASLKRNFDFDIPTAIVKKVLRERLKKDGFVSIDHHGVYWVDMKKVSDDNTISDELKATKDTHLMIFESLVAFVEEQGKQKLSANDRDSLGDNFHSYLLLDDITGEKHARFISSFIIQNERNSDFRTSLNLIKEGLILYTGIKYTADLENLGSWRSDLTIFLDTEILFSALGYNGAVYEQMFADFFKLVTEINNLSVAKTGKPKISLRYFEEIRVEVENYFFAAEMRMRGFPSDSLPKIAMKNILNGCSSPGDVVAKKTKSFMQLTSKGIAPEKPINYYANPLYNVEDQITIENLKKACTEGHVNYAEDEPANFLKLFTKVNVLRKGVSNTSFENVRCIFLTGKFLAKFLAQDIAVKFNANDVPFATDLDFLTNKFWFRLGKGFGNSNDLPRSFDIVTKARIIISSQMRKKASVQYDKLVSDKKEGSISEEAASELSYELRVRPNQPEDFTFENIDETLSFLNEDTFERLTKERQVLHQLVAEGASAKKELKQRKTNDWLATKRPLKLMAKAEGYIWLSIFALALAAYLSLAIYLIYKVVMALLAALSTAENKFFENLPGVIAFLVLIFQVLISSRSKTIFAWLRLKVKNRINRKYRERLREKVLDR